MLTEPDDIVDMWLAAMKDAACGTLTQVQMTIAHPSTGKPTLVRVIVVPEKMEFQLGQESTSGKSGRS